MVLKFCGIFQRIKQYISFRIQKCDTSRSCLTKGFIQIGISHLFDSILNVFCTVPNALFQIFIVLSIHDKSCGKKRKKYRKNNQKTGMIQDFFSHIILRSGNRLPVQFLSDFLLRQASGVVYGHGHQLFLSHHQNHIPIHDRESDFCS